MLWHNDFPSLTFLSPINVQASLLQVLHFVFFLCIFLSSSSFLLFLCDFIFMFDFLSENQCNFFSFQTAAGLHDTHWALLLPVLLFSPHVFIHHCSMPLNFCLLSALICVFVLPPYAVFFFSCLCLSPHPPAGCSRWLPLSEAGLPHVKSEFFLPTITFWLLFGNHDCWGFPLIFQGLYPAEWSTVRWLLFWFEAIKMNLNWTENWFDYVNSKFQKFK